MNKKTSTICAYFSDLVTNIICCGCSNEPPWWDDSNELPNQKSKPMHKKTSIICANFSYLATKIKYCGYSRKPSQNLFTRKHQLSVLASPLNHTVAIFSFGLNCWLQGLKVRIKTGKSLIRSLLLKRLIWVPMLLSYDVASGSEITPCIIIY